MCHTGVFKRLELQLRLLQRLLQKPHFPPYSFICTIILTRPITPGYHSDRLCGNSSVLCEHSGLFSDPAVPCQSAERFFILDAVHTSKR